MKIFIFPFLYFSKGKHRKNYSSWKQFISQLTIQDRNKNTFYTVSKYSIIGMDYVSYIKWSLFPRYV